MIPRLLQFALVCFVVFLVLPMPVMAQAAGSGSANDPHILSRPNTSAQLRGEVIPHLEITRGWIEVEERSGEPDRFRFVMQVASLPPVNEIPKNSVYVFHYTTQDLGRLFFRANWSADNTQFEFIGGIYAGCRAGVCPPFDDQGNRNYLYMPGGASQRANLEGEVIPGAPGRITWSYPMEAYAPAERLNGFEMKGLFAATYTFTGDRALRYADVALGIRDFLHTDNPAWHERFLAQIPGPAPLLVPVGLLALAGFSGRWRRQNDDGSDGADTL